jgi:hypothetical protein
VKTGGTILKLCGLLGDSVVICRELCFVIFSRFTRVHSRMSKSVLWSVDGSVPADSSTSSEYLKPGADNLDNKQVRNEDIKNTCR